MSLEICSDGHDEICYCRNRFGKCPACEKIQEVTEEKDKEIERLEGKIEDLESR